MPQAPHSPASSASRARLKSSAKCSAIQSVTRRSLKPGSDEVSPCTASASAAAAVAGSQQLILNVYPAYLSQVVDGMDALLRVPSGCFEQTTSTAWPNVLVTAYLKQTKQLKPEVQLKAESLMSAGYQRLLTFEHAGGGSLALSNGVFLRRGTLLATPGSVRRVPRGGSDRRQSVLRGASRACGHGLPHLHPAEAPLSSASSRWPAPRHPPRPVSRAAGARDPRLLRTQKGTERTRSSWVRRLVGQGPLRASRAARPEHPSACARREPRACGWRRGTAR